MISDFWHYDFLWNALVGTVCLAIMGGLYSPFVVAKRYAFLGEGIGHSTLLGSSLVLAWLGQASSLEIFLPSLLITLVATFFLARATRSEQIPSDALIGVYLVAALAVGLIVTHISAPQNNNFNALLFGNILLLSATDLIIIKIVTLIAILYWARFYRSLIFYSFDPQGASLLLPFAQLLHYSFFALLTLVIVSCVKISGAFLINALLLIPGLMAYDWAKKMPQVFALSTALSLLLCLVGTVLANAFDLPVGASIALVLFAGLVLSKAFKKGWQR